MMGLGLLLLIISLIYMILMIGLWWRWKKLPVKHVKDEKIKLKISILIAMRNEEENIKRLLETLCLQDSTSEFLHILIVNDHSEDNSKESAESFKGRLAGLKILDQEEGKTGKKAALQSGLKYCNGDIILCTDADCIPGDGWISGMSSVFADEGIMMASGPVQFYETKSFIRRWMELEFLGLNASGAASFGSRFPLMCNGANLAFRKSAMIKAGGFVQSTTFESGDDIMSMLSIHKLFPKGLKFIKNRKCLVKTEAPKSLKEFMQQRIRWSSKTGKYFSAQILFYAGIVGMMNILLITLLVLSFANITFIPALLLLVLFKALVDYPLLKSVSRWAGRPELIVLLLPAEIINALYVILIFLIAPFVSYSWKDRKMR